jgi:hypothetical protein
MDQAAADVVAEPEQPQDEKYRKDRPQHRCCLSRRDADALCEVLWLSRVATVAKLSTRVIFVSRKRTGRMFMPGCGEGIGSVSVHSALPSSVTGHALWHSGASGGVGLITRIVIGGADE